MIDILARLKQIQENNPNLNVGDAIANVERTNGAVAEKAKNPYAIGMAQAMKSTGDTPPLKKSTITKAHDIAKSIEKNEGETDEGNEFSQAVQKARAAGMKIGDKFKVGDKEYTLKDDSNNEGEIDEAMTKKHFQHVADTLKQIEDPKKRAEYAKHHSAIFQHSNPRFDHAKFMKAAGVDEMEEGRVKDWLMDLESDANEMTRDEFIKKHGQSQAHVWDKTNQENKENEGKEIDEVSKDTLHRYVNKAAVSAAHNAHNQAKGYNTMTGEPQDKAKHKLDKRLVGIKTAADKLSTKTEEGKAKPDFLDFDKDGNTKEPMKKAIKDKEKKLNESVVIATDNPQEAAMMMQLLKLAGVRPVDQDMINPHEPEAQTDEDYANTPNEKTQSVDDLVNANSGGLNKQKIQVKKEYPGDNPLNVMSNESEITEEQLSNSLRAQYESFKQTYQTAIEEAKKSYSAKKAAAGKDIGKPGKNFEKIAKSAGKRYGSKEAGKRVAGAVLAKLRAK